MPRLVLVTALFAIIAGCVGRPSPACLDRCATFGVDTTACARICTASCDHLRDTYGMSVETCEELQSGADVKSAPAP